MIEYMADNNEMLIQILQTLNNFQLQTTAAFSEVRAEIKKSREIENEHWQENLRRWDENDKRWEENDRRWAENDKRWEENKKLWEENKKLWKENEINRKNDKNDILNILINYDISISTQLKDKNVSKMKRFLKA
jgi:septal ring factor EnvC (AmiA/AmiB activator)